MKSVFILIPLIFVQAFGPRAQRKPNAATEPFREFLDRYTSDPQFRTSRTASPLIIRVVNPDTEETRTERWLSWADVKEHVPPLSATELTQEGLRQRIRRISAHTYEVFQYRYQADSYRITYRFVSRKGRWYLVSLRDFSM